MRPNFMLASLLTAVLLPACGGKVLFGEGSRDGGSGGDGGSSTNVSTSPATNSTTSSTMTSTNQSVSVSTTSVGGAPPLDCKSACDTLYNCGLQDGLCPGFDGSPGQKNTFVQVCFEDCSKQPALINLINEDNCPGTIGNLKAVSDDFATVCEGPASPR